MGREEGLRISLLFPCHFPPKICKIVRISTLCCMCLEFSLSSNDHIFENITTFENSTLFSIVFSKTLLHVPESTKHIFRSKISQDSCDFLFGAWSQVEKTWYFTTIYDQKKSKLKRKKSKSSKSEMYDRPKVRKVPYDFFESPKQL